MGRHARYPVFADARLIASAQKIEHCEIAAYGMADDQLAGPARQPHPSAVALQLSRAARAACRLKVGISVGTDRCLPASPIGAEVVGRRL